MEIPSRKSHEVPLFLVPVYRYEIYRQTRSKVERQNGRAAMLGITGCLVHELLGVDALYPTGGLGGAAPPAIF